MIQFDMNKHPYPVQRQAIVAKNGMVSTGSSLASAVGLQILQKGGNAIDAAIATAAALTVVEPTANGIGSDCFAIVWIKDKLYGLNASGYAPKDCTISQVFKKHGEVDIMPKFGWTPITIPGSPKGWAALNQRWGLLSLEECLAPAIEYATNGFPVSSSLAYFWQKAFEQNYQSLQNQEEYQEWFNTFTFDGQLPKVGQIITLPNHAKSLLSIAKTNSDSFYKGEIAHQIVLESQKHQGFISYEDLASYEVEWVDPIRINYRGYDICEIPPNGQGLVALLGLNILKNFTFDTNSSVDTLHKQFEATKIAFKEGLDYITDLSCMKVSYHDLCSEDEGKKKATWIKENASTYEILKPAKAGTVYLATADKWGNMVSFIQSNYSGFGSGIVIKDTGISMQNRGSDFSLDKNHPNVLTGRKKTYHTIIPGFILKDNQPVGPIGVMGGYMQPQGHIQVVMNMIDFHMNPQMALDACRWQWIKENTFHVEPGFSEEVIEQLREKGHIVEVSDDFGSFGRGQIIVRNHDGVYIGGCDSRTDSNIACY